MDTNATDGPAVAETPPPVPQYACFPAKEPWLTTGRHIGLVFLAIAVFASADALRYFLPHLATGDPVGTSVSFGFIKTGLIILMPQLFIAFWDGPKNRVKDYRIVGDRFMKTLASSCKDYPLKQLSRVVIYEGNDKAPLLVELNFRFHGRVMAANLSDMQGFALSLRAAIPDNAVVMHKPHIGDRYLPIMVALYGMLLLGMFFTQDSSPVLFAALVLALVAEFIAFLIVLSRNRSLNYLTRWPLSHT